MYVLVLHCLPVNKRDQYYRDMQKLNNSISAIVTSIAISVLLINSGCAIIQKKKPVCVENHAAMDFGSGATKALVVEVDICQKKIGKIVFQEHLALPLNESLEKSKDEKIPQAVAESAVPKLKEFIEKVRQYRPAKIIAVGTSVFRVAKNGSEIAQFFSDQLNLKVRVISQVEEAELGYYSVLSLGLVQDTEKLIVWDIGGGSMQMYMMEKGQPQIFEGSLASVTYKNLILEKIQNKDPKKVFSPNPIGKKYLEALDLSKKHALGNVPDIFKTKSAEASWYGIGGVISYSVQGQVQQGSNTFTQDQLFKAFKQRSKLRDQDIPSEYRITDVSNMGLVLGYMQALGINSLTTVKASLGQGLLFRDLK